MPYINNTEIATRNPDAEIIQAKMWTSKTPKINPYETQKISASHLNHKTHEMFASH